jgi:tRNA threonylcarbamoyladenosine biosynthesis protein TsaB
VRVLAVETATGWQSVALLDEAEVVASLEEDAGGSHAKRLVPAIDRLLKDTGWSLASLDGLVVSIGPGSFTGLRVGLATMLGYRSVTGLPLVAVPTLEGLAWNLRGSDELLCPVLKSRLGEVYWAQYRWAEGRVLNRVAPEQVGGLDALAETLTDRTVVYGEGWLANREALLSLSERRGRHAHEAPCDKMQASAVSVGLAGQELLGRGSLVGADISPRYVQRAEAELNWESKRR